MSNYTAELRTIIDNGFNIFDFDYQRNSESVNILPNEDLQNGFINRYYFREVGFETLERFKHKLKTQWLESITNFDKLLVEYSKEINVMSNSNLTTENVNIFNDTPKSAIDYGNESNHASTITHDKQTASGLGGLTEIEALELYHDKLKDIITEFYDSFDNLFMQIF